MDVNRAIYEHYGIRLGPVPADGKMRSFKIDQLRNGFLVKIEDCAVFGSIIDGERIVFDGDSYRSYEVEHKRSDKIRHEWLIWEAARVMLEAGEALGSEDSERLALAVRRLEEWL